MTITPHADTGVNRLAPVLFVSHGGGPMPLLNDPGHREMIAACAQIREKLLTMPQQPRALLYVSAHWEATAFKLTTAAQPELLYDYYGFPPESYNLHYPVAGAPELAQTLMQALSAEGIDVSAEDERGLDHGVFVPGLLLFPDANIPTLQISLRKGLNPAAHLELGKALRFLREQNVMIIGSGFSFHNMREFFSSENPDGDQLNQAFEDWLSDTLRLDDAAEREQRLLNWEKAPGARFCHPREEHLIPLHVCVTAANSTISKHWQFEVLTKQGSCYWWD